MKLNNPCPPNKKSDCWDKYCNIRLDYYCHKTPIDKLAEIYRCSPVTVMLILKANGGYTEIGPNILTEEDATRYKTTQKELATKRRERKLQEQIKNGGLTPQENKILKRRPKNVREETATRYILIRRDYEYMSIPELVEKYGGCAATIEMYLKASSKQYSWLGVDLMEFYSRTEDYEYMTSYRKNNKAIDSMPKVQVESAPETAPKIAVQSDKKCTIDIPLSGDRVVTVSFPESLTSSEATKVGHVLEALVE